MIKIQANRAIKVYGLNDGIKLVNNATKHWVASQSIFLEFTTRYMLESNRVSEHSNGLVEHMARVLLINAPEVDDIWWPEATQAVVYLLNKLLSNSLGTQTLLDVFF